MKTFSFSFQIAVLLAVSFFAVSCGRSVVSTKPGSSGKTLEMLFVADHDVYTAALQSTVDSLFRATQLGLPQVEPLFDVVNIPMSSFTGTDMFRVHRNVIVCDVKSSNPNKVYVYEDKYAVPQVVFEVAAADVSALDSLLCHYSANIIRQMRHADHRRIIKAFYNTRSVELMNEVEKRFNFTLTLPTEFAMAKPNNPENSFAWVRKEAKDFGIGVLIDVKDYKNADDFKQSFILDNLDTIMRRHVMGSADNSYMGIERRLDCYTTLADIENSPYAVETRGVWRTFGDFMGGPFVSYTILSPDSMQVVTLTGYVYCPRFKKRDYLMQVEGICHSIVFDTVSR